ncbi:MAG: LysR family transcriptional regulator [Spirochaetaceae bacterium]|jgi:DNA-binding transcriptional LysR family regulator|nr:LysR family transcriptional regulator [Spirochaetaceae bacterium]
MTSRQLTVTSRQLEYILAIAEQGNITQAAQKLYISQPSLSSVLAHVEDIAGAKLFDRSLSPMPLTYAGELYVQMAQKIFAVTEEFRRQVDDIRNELTGRLNIGCGPYRSPLIIPAILPVLVKLHPGVQYKVTEDSSSVLEEQLLTGVLDVIFSVGKLKNPAVTCTALVKEEMLLLSPKDMRLPFPCQPNSKNAHCIDLQKAGQLPFVLMKQGHQLRVIIDRIFADAGYIPNIILETSSWETCLRMVEAGIALTILPNARSDVIGIYEERIHKYRLKGDYYQHIFLCYRKNAYFSKVMTEFIKIALSVFSENDGHSRETPTEREELKK